MSDRSAKVSLSNRAYEILRTEIISCALEPGQQIAQAQLAERYHVGTTPVREALQRLVQEGLIQVIPRFGYVVGFITLSDVLEIYELRSILESAAVRLAAARGTQDQLDQLRQQADFTYVYKDRGSYSAFLAHNTQFHRSVAALAGNRRLAEKISMLLDEMTRIFHLGLDLRDSALEMRDEHQALAQALCAGDPGLAEQLVQQQIARSQARVLEALTSRFAPMSQAIKLSSSGGVSPLESQP